MFRGGGWVSWTLKIPIVLKQQVHVNPCSAVPRNNYPAGRIIHNYNFPNKNSSYLLRYGKTFNCNWLAHVSQPPEGLPTTSRPSHWHTQIHFLNLNDCYSDVTMPSGKANPSRVFCTSTCACCKYFQSLFQSHYSFPIYLLHMDDFFEGTVRRYSLSAYFRNEVFWLVTLSKLVKSLKHIWKELSSACEVYRLSINFNWRKPVLC